MLVMPALANGGTYITVKARDVVNMAHNPEELQVMNLSLNDFRSLKLKERLTCRTLLKR